LIGWLRRLHAQLPLGLAERFTLFVAVLLLGLTAGFVTVNNREAQRNATASFEDNAAHMVALVDALASDLPPERRIADLQAVLDRVAASNENTRYAYAVELNADGTMKEADPASVARDPIAAIALLEAVSGGMPAVRRGDGVLHIATPIKSGNRVIGVARVGISTGNMEAAVSAAVSRNIVLALLFIVIALPASALFSNYLTAPVRRLTQATRRLSAGDFAVSVPETRNDELGELSRSFVAMTKSIVDSFEAVQKLTLTDRTSGLANREQARRYVQGALERGEIVALLYLDIDRLKRVNEALGMDVGDDAIVAISERLKAVAVDYRENYLRENPGKECDVLVARLGGDEFGFVLNCAVSEENAGQLAAKLLGAFARPFEIAGHAVSVTGSAGIALAPEDGNDFSALLRSAANGLAEAKNSGRATYKFARRDVNSYAYRRLVIEQELRQARERNELEVFYQPQVALTDGAIIGAEALVRWRHPSRGLVLPADFIEIAEDVGLLDSIDTFVLTEACRQSSVWQLKGMTPKISVNVSASQCQRPGFAESVLQIVSDAGIAPSSIEIEITETVAMLDPRTTARDLAPLRAAGVRLAIDDFGTGYSNLASLTRMPVDVLKIDRSFVSECVRDGSARVVVATILTMTQNLGFETVAEGVESAAQREFLLAQGCTFAQGYLFGKPMTAQEFETLYVAKRRSGARDLLGQVRRKAGNRAEA
jgi:diguanylate cyclase (GGDEF)-like protein